MADDLFDPNPELRAEYEAALAAINPEIRGLHYVANDSVSSELITNYNEQIVEREHRRDLIQAAVDSLDFVVVARRTLAADGYPILPKIQLSTELYQEAKRQNSDTDAALGIFESPPVASRISAELGPPADKPHTTR
jgi:hypothetical protein